MAQGIPDGLAIETIWVVEAALGPDAAERRAPVRTEHLRRLGDLRAAGVVIEAGAFADMSASLLLIRAATEDQAMAVVRDDVYTKVGVWVSFRARPLGRVARVDELPRR